MTDMTETTATEFKKKLTNALKKLDSNDIEIETLLELIKKIKITKKKSVKRDPTPYNNFMQKSMKQVRIDQPDLLQKDVMRESVRLWHEHKSTDI